MNYYNEFNPHAAAMLRQLITDGLIPPGDVDERSIEDVRAEELEKYIQCHFFTGIAGWPLALALARWPANRPVWTGSCPCQDYSSAGKQKGQDGERHLWPVWFKNLIRERKPATVFGEQVKNAIVFGWLDEVAHDFEKEKYAFAAAVLPGYFSGSPQQRDRIFFVANSEDEMRARESREISGTIERPKINDCDKFGESGFMGHAINARLQGHAGDGEAGDGEAGDKSRWNDKKSHRPITSTGFWDDVESVVGFDGKIRPVKPGIRLLVNGFPQRVACQHGLGNAIIPQVAADFIRATM